MRRSCERPEFLLKKAQNSIERCKIDIDRSQKRRDHAATSNPLSVHFNHPYGQPEHSQNRPSSHQSIEGDSTQQFIKYTEEEQTGIIPEIVTSERLRYTDNRILLIDTNPTIQAPALPMNSGSSGYSKRKTSGSPKSGPKISTPKVMSRSDVNGGKKGVQVIRPSKKTIERLNTGSSKGSRTKKHSGEISRQRTMESNSSSNEPTSGQMVSLRDSIRSEQKKMQLRPGSGQLPETADIDPYSLTLTSAQKKKGMAKGKVEKKLDKPAGKKRGSDHKIRVVSCTEVEEGQRMGLRDVNQSYPTTAKKNESPGSIIKKLRGDVYEMSVDSKKNYAHSKSKEAELQNGEFLALPRSQTDLHAMSTSGFNQNQFGSFGGGMNIDRNQMEQLKSKHVVADATYLLRDYRQLGYSSARKSDDSSKV